MTLIPIPGYNLWQCILCGHPNDNDEACVECIGLDDECPCECPDHRTPYPCKACSDDNATATADEPQDERS